MSLPCSPKTQSPRHYDPTQFRKFSLSKSHISKDYPMNLGQNCLLSPSNQAPLYLKTSTSTKSMKKSTDYSSILSKISDFHSKEQINKAIDSAETFQDRVHIVDQILKRRQEIKEMEDEMKVARAAPIIKELVSNFRHKIKRKNPEMVQNHFRKSLISLFSPSDTPKAENLVKPVVIDLATNETDNTLTAPAHGRQAHYSPHITIIQADGSDVNNSPTNQTPFSFKPDEDKSCVLNRSVSKRCMTLSPKVNDSNKLGLFGDTPQHRASIFMLTRSRAESQTSGLPDLEGNNNSQKSRQLPERPATQQINTHRKVSRSKTKIGPSSYEYGKEKLQQELYRFLVKNENKDACKDVVFNLGKTKEARIKDIQESTRRKYECFVKNKKKSLNVLPNSARSKKNSSEPASPRVFSN